MVQTKYKSYRDKNIYREANQYPVETKKYRRGVIENGIYKGRNENVEDEIVQKILAFPRRRNAIPIIKYMNTNQIT